MTDHDAGRCQLEVSHDGMHLALTEGPVLALSVPVIEVHRYSAYRIALWVRSALWAAGFHPSTA